MKANNEIFFSVIIFGVGGLFGLVFSSFFDIQVNPVVSLSELLSVIITILLGIYLGITIASRVSSSRFEKDFLISEAKRITDYIDSDSTFKNTHEFDHNATKGSFKNLNIAIFNFESILKDAECSDRLNTMALRNAFRQFRVSVLDISPQSGIIRPGVEDRIKIVGDYANLRREVFRIIRKINEHRN